MTPARAHIRMYAHTVNQTADRLDQREAVGGKKTDAYLRLEPPAVFGL